MKAATFLRSRASCESQRNDCRSPPHCCRGQDAASSTWFTPSGSDPPGEVRAKTLTAPGRMTPRLQDRPRKTAHQATMIIVHQLVTKRAGVCEATPRAAAIDGLTDSGSGAVTVDHAASARTDRSLPGQRPIRTGKSAGSHPHGQFRCQQYRGTCRSKSQGTRSPERGNSTGPSESAELSEVISAKFCW